MHEFKALVDRLQESLHQSKEYRQFKQLQEAINQQPEIAAWEDELKSLQQTMVAALDKHQTALYEETKKVYEQKKVAFDEHPLIHSYRMAQEELNDLLIEIAHLIENGLSSK